MNVELTLISQSLALATVVAQFCILLVIFYLLFFRKKYGAPAKLLAKYGLLLALLTSLVATLGSLFYSQVMGFAPCDLCWFQRIFMYPLVVLLGMALVKKDLHIIDYALSITVRGFIISLYQNYLYYYNGGLSAFCQLVGQGVSCVKRYVFEFGYVTIPMMALIAFTLLIFFLIAARYRNHAQQ